jgi:hypothetical protein
MCFLFLILLKIIFKNIKNISYHSLKKIKYLNNNLFNETLKNKFLLINEKKANDHLMSISLRKPKKTTNLTINIKNKYYSFSIGQILKYIKITIKKIRRDLKGILIFLNFFKKLINKNYSTSNKIIILNYIDYNFFYMKENLMNFNNINFVLYKINKKKNTTNIKKIKKIKKKLKKKIIKKIIY